MEIKDISSNLNSEDEVIDFIDDEPEFEELNNEENGCPCDAFGVCPFDANSGYDCRNYCGVGVG